MVKNQKTYLDKEGNTSKTNVQENPIISLEQISVSSKLNTMPTTVTTKSVLLDVYFNNTMKELNENENNIKWLKLFIEKYIEYSNKEILLSEIINEMVMLYARYTDESREGKLYCFYSEMFDYYGPNVYKLGRAVDTNKRICGYSTICPIDGKLMHETNIISDYVVGENILFRMLKEYRLYPNKEFFQCDIAIIKDKMTKIEEMFKKYSVSQIIKTYELNIFIPKIIKFEAEMVKIFRVKGLIDFFHIKDNLEEININNNSKSEKIDNSSCNKLINNGVQYKCNRCSKLFKQKTDYTRHINRKYPCENVLSNLFSNSKNDTRSNLLLSILVENINKSTDESNLISDSKNESQLIHHKPIKNDNNLSNNQYSCVKYNKEQTKAQENTKFICNACDKTFMRKDTLKRHMDKRCKMKNVPETTKMTDYSDTSKAIKELREKIDELITISTNKMTQ